MEGKPVKLDLEFFEELLFLNYERDKPILRNKIIDKINTLPKNLSKESFFECCYHYIKVFKDECLKKKNCKIKDLEESIDFDKNNPHAHSSEFINNKKNDLKIVKSKSYMYLKFIDCLGPKKNIYISMNEIEEIEELCNTIEKEINNRGLDVNNKTLKDFLTPEYYKKLEKQLISKMVIDDDFVIQKQAFKKFSELQVASCIGWLLETNNCFTEKMFAKELVVVLSNTFNEKLIASTYSSAKIQFENSKEFQIHNDYLDLLIFI